MLNRRLLIILAVVAPLALATLWFSGQDEIAPQAAPRSADELEKLDDQTLVASLASEVARRLYAKGFDPSAWRRLEGPPLHVWVVVSVEGEVMRSGLVQFLSETPATSPRPGLVELARAYQEIGLPGPAAVVAEAARRFAEQPDPGKDATVYARLQMRLQQHLRTADAPQVLITYGRKHLAAFAAIP